MKKIAKLSLVAAVAVAGLTTANAQQLEDAIKKVEVSGSVVYRYNDYNSDVNDDATKYTVVENNPGKTKSQTEAGAFNGRAGTESTSNNNYKVGLNLAAPVNDFVKLNTRFIVGSQTTGSFVELDTAGHDGQADVTLSNVYFGYTGIKNTTVNVGKQGLTTPWTTAIDSDGNEQTGTGILALSTVGPVTLAGAYFNQTNLDNSSDSVIAGSTTADSTKVTSVLKGNESIATIGAIAAAGPVTLDAWYLVMNDTLDSYTIGAKSALDLSDVKVAIDARWASLDLDNNNNKQEMGKLVLTADAGLVDGKLAYAMTGNEGGLTALDNDAVTTLLGWNLALNGKTDADYVQAVLGFDVLSNLNLSANYGNLQYITTTTTDVEEEEVYAQLLYKMSKNLSTYVRYGTYTKETTAQGAATVENNDDVRGRLQVEYTF